MTKSEFRIHLKSEINGEIRVYKHIMNMCRVILKDRRKMRSKQSLDRLVRMNTHLWDCK